MRVPSSGSPVVNTRGPTRTPASIASRSSWPSNALAAGLRTVVTPNASKMRPERLAVRLRQVRVALDQAGQHGGARRVDDGAAMQVVAVRRDGR